MSNIQRRPHSILDRILAHETPVFAAVSVATTIIGEALVLIDLLTRPNWGTGGLLITVLLYGTALHVLLGLIAAARASTGVAEPPHRE